MLSLFCQFWNRWRLNLIVFEGGGKIGHTTSNLVPRHENTAIIKQILFDAALGKPQFVFLVA